MSNNVSRRDFMKLSALTAGALATSGSLLTPAVAKAARRQNLANHIILGNTSIQPNLNPFYFTYFQSRQIYDTLIEVSADGQQLLPGLATEWNRVDGQTLEITLRDDVFFSNGERLTSRSVQYTLEFLLTIGIQDIGNYAIPITDLVLFPPPFALFNMDSIEIIDDTNFVLRTTRPDAITERRLSRLFIISEQYMNENNNNLITDAVGTGYFRVAEFEPGVRIEFETWEGNWRGEFPVTSATYVQVGNVRAALESGDIDIAQSLPADVARTLVDSGDWAASTKPAFGTEFASMIPGTHPAFDDVRVRRALNLAVDKEAYNEIIRGGFGRPTTGQLLQPGMDGYNADLDPFPYDPAEAQRLLAEAGYRNLELTMLAANTVATEAETIASFLESVGIRIDLETPDSGTVITEVRAGTERNLVFWNAFYTTLQDWTQAMVGIAPQAPGSQQHFDNEEFAALNAQINTEGDPETRTGLIEQAAGLMNEEAALLFVSWTDWYYIHSPNIADLPYNLDNSVQIYAIEKSV